MTNRKLNVHAATHAPPTLNTNVYAKRATTKIGWAASAADTA